MHETMPSDSKDRPGKRSEPNVSDLQFRSHHRFVFILAALYFSLWTILAIAPVYRDDWALENIVVLAGILVLVFTWSRYAFSRFSYFLMALFLTLHAVGSHFTYSEVPYREWLEYFFGETVQTTEKTDRNHYDRIVHFAYGLLLYYPFRECFLQFAKVRWKLWSHLVPLSFILSTSLLYELLEWAAAVVLGGDVGIEFLGSQGDIWDAQKDSFCAFIGAAIAMASIAIVFYATKRDYPIEWIQFQKQHLEARCNLRKSEQSL